ncbi:MAG: glycosyltransferase family 4 protein [bacterium]|nr:glycosyltransferase family 4 protein [bacterium]
MDGRKLPNRPFRSTDRSSGRRSIAEHAINICYVSPPGTIGGGEVSLLHLVANLSQSGYRPIVITYGTGDLVDRLQENGIEVHTFERGGRLSELTLIYRLAAFFRRRRIRMVHVNMLDIRAGLAARLASCKLVGHLRVIFPTTWVDRLFVHLSHRCIAVSEAARKIFASDDKSLYHKFVVIPNGVHLGSFSAADLKGELGLPPQSVLIGAVGRLDPFKGFEHFIGAVPSILVKIPEARFLIVGRPGNEHE